MTETTEAAKTPRDRFAFLAPLLITATFIGAYAYRLGLPKYPVRDAGERIVHTILIAGILGIISDLVCSKTRRWMVPSFALIATIVCLVPAMEPRVNPNGWSNEFALWLGLIAISTAALTTIAYHLAIKNEHRPLMPLVMAGMTLATGGLLASTGSMKLGEETFCFVPGVILFPVLVGFFFRPFARSAGTVIVVFSVIATQLTSGHLWSELPIWATFTIAAAPIIAWIVTLGPIARRPRWIRVTIALLLAATPATVAVTMVAIPAYKASKELGAEEAW